MTTANSSQPLSTHIRCSPENSPLLPLSVNRQFPRDMAATQTTTIETVSVIRPLKVISLVCFIIAIVLAIVSICSTYWLTSGSFHTGLFQECTTENEPSHATPLPLAPMPGQCHSPQRDSAYIKAVAGLMIAAVILTAIAALFNIVGLSVSDSRRKFNSYRVATYVAILAVVCELVGLIVFPAVFYSKMKDYGSRRDWEVDWSYGLAWGAVVLTFAGTLLLICDKDSSEVHYKEKTIYHPPPELA